MPRDGMFLISDSEEMADQVVQSSRGFASEAQAIYLEMVAKVLMDEAREVRRRLPVQV